MQAAVVPLTSVDLVFTTDVLCHSVYNHCFVNVQVIHTKFLSVTETLNKDSFRFKRPVQNENVSVQMKPQTSRLLSQIV